LLTTCGWPIPSTRRLCARSRWAGCWIISWMRSISRMGIRGAILVVAPSIGRITIFHRQGRIFWWWLRLSF